MTTENRWSEDPQAVITIDPSFLQREEACLELVTVQDLLRTLGIFFQVVTREGVYTPAVGFLGIAEDKAQALRAELHVTPVVIDFLPQSDVGEWFRESHLPHQQKLQTFFTSYQGQD